jgi:hypothetical protein
MNARARDPSISERGCGLFRRWAGLPVNLDLVENYCAAAIYDQHDSRKRIFTIGAVYLLDEQHV